MRPREDNIPRSEPHPFDMLPEAVEEENLLLTLRILVASGKIDRDDVERAWRLAFIA